MTYEKKEKTKPIGVPATYLSLCSGYDGIGIALSRIFPNLRTLAHVEIESFPIANMVAAMEADEMDTCPVFTDVKAFPFEELRGRVGILSAGFPCQPFSSAGKRQATEDPRHIYPYIADGITACRPAFVMLENVEGIISAKTGDGESVLLHVLRDLEERGYVCTWGTFSAAETCAPHLRKRVFILAKLADCDLKGLEGHGGSVVESEASERYGERDEWSAAFGSIQHSCYPARPNEPQNQWEEPRVVGDAKSLLREHSHGETDSGGSAQEEAGGHGSSGGEEAELADSRHTESSGRNEAEEGSVQESFGESPPQDSGGGELADAKSGKPRKSQGGNRRKDTGGGSEEELGDSSSERLRGGSENRPDVESEMLREGLESELADPEHAKRGTHEGISSRDERREGSSGDVEGCIQTDLPETESELGGTTDAWGGLRGVDPIANRVDRLRLLGNGVCPDTCELAVRILYNRLLKGNNQ